MTLDRAATSSISVGEKGAHFTQTKQLSVLLAHSRTSTDVQKENMLSALVQLDPHSHTHFWPGQLHPQRGVSISKIAAGSTAALWLG